MHADARSVCKVARRDWHQLDYMFTRLTCANAEDSYEDFLSSISRERTELVTIQPRHMKLYYRNALLPLKQLDILTSLIVDSCVEQADFPTLRDFLSGKSPNHYFVVLVPSISAGKQPAIARAIAKWRFMFPPRYASGFVAHKAASKSSVAATVGDAAVTFEHTLGA